ncbi:glycosyltransferase [Lederbergia lenta]|uniref:glycosyltransferase n=1 Tax=Lederbergia lenta TaxID=1467 RepID=UPI00203D7D57|nr:glycosyltransferase [Lederbergia lenta]MCM3111983.1 glycosyltransferase [Lederbergia lenta]
MKKLLVMSFTDLKSDPRVNRQIRMLKNEYSIITVGEKESGIDNVQFIKVEGTKRNFAEKVIAGCSLLFKKYKNIYWRSSKVISTYNKLKDIDFDIIIANDIDTLPLAIKVAKDKDAKIIFDAHEYYPRQFEDNLRWNLMFKGYYYYLCKRYLKEPDAMLTVCEGLADEYSKEFGIKPTVLTNAPDFERLFPNKVEEKIKIIHHGIANKSRKIENMIVMMDYLDERFELDLMLVKKNPEYYNSLKEMVSKRSNVRLINPVEMREISKYINNYDIGLFLLEPTNFNYKMALPNKFFEFIQARLMVAIGPSPQMEKIVNESKCGIVSESFLAKSLAEKLNKLEIDDIYNYKKNSHMVAEQLSSLKNRDILINTIRNIDVT